MPANAMQQSAATQMEKEVASRIMALRLDSGYSQEQMADMTGFDLADYAAYESGSADLPFSFIHKCASVFDVEIMELLEGKTPLLTGYTLTRSGGGQLTSVEPGIVIKNVAHLFKDRIADPYYVVYNYNEAQQHEPIEQVTHPGQEFDYVLEGSMKIKIKDNEEVLHAGDSIFYNSGNPHGIIAVGGKDVRFLAIVLPEEGADLKWEHGRLISKEAPAAIKKEVSPDALKAPNFVSNFVTVKEREDGYPEEVTFKNTDRFNFAFDVVDAIAEKEPDRLCMVHLDRNKVERRFTFQDMKKMSAR
ncbi:MAG: cupin domain-containing protein, partial [Lachnospiraceae bacterium]|nr:cupin domain-containing protein [Lachnospiraceae bacterium]